MNGIEIGLLIFLAFMVFFMVDNTIKRWLKFKEDGLAENKRRWDIENPQPVSKARDEVAERRKQRKKEHFTEDTE